MHQIHSPLEQPVVWAALESVAVPPEEVTVKRDVPHLVGSLEGTDQLALGRVLE